MFLQVRASSPCCGIEATRWLPAARSGGKLPARPVVAQSLSTRSRFAPGVFVSMGGHCGRSLRGDCPRDLHRCARLETRAFRADSANVQVSGCADALAEPNYAERGFGSGGSMPVFPSCGTAARGYGRRWRRSTRHTKGCASALWAPPRPACAPPLPVARRQRWPYCTTWGNVVSAYSRRIRRQCRSPEPTMPAHSLSSAHAVAT